jgi:hypothetical protein
MSHFETEMTSSSIGVGQLFGNGRFLEEAFLQAHRMNVTKKASFISFLNLFN